MRTSASRAGCVERADRFSISKIRCAHDATTAKACGQYLNSRLPRWMRRVAATMRRCCSTSMATWPKPRHQRFRVNGVPCAQRRKVVDPDGNYPRLDSAACGREDSDEVGILTVDDLKKADEVFCAARRARFCRRELDGARMESPRRASHGADTRRVRSAKREPLPSGITGCTACPQPNSGRRASSK